MDIHSICPSQNSVYILQETIYSMAKKHYLLLERICQFNERETL